MTTSSPASLQHLIAGRWVAGTGEDVSSVDPSQPDIIVAEGAAAGSADVDAAVAAAAEAARA